ELREGDRRGAARGPSLGEPLHRLPARGGAPVTESSTRVSADVRVGSATDGLTPFSTAVRSLAAGTSEWLALAAVAVAAVAADQLTKHIVSSQLALGDEVKLVGPLSIHHVQNSGIAFGLFSSATAIVIVLTAFSVGWMLLFFARSGSRH